MLNYYQSKNALNNTISLDVFAAETVNQFISLNIKKKPTSVPSKPDKIKEHEKHKVLEGKKLLEKQKELEKQKDRKNKALFNKNKTDLSQKNHNE